MKKYVRVTATIEQQFIHDVLRAFEDAGEAKVEVRAFIPKPNGPDQEQEQEQEQVFVRERLRKIKLASGGTRTLGIRDRVREAMKMGEPFQYWTMAKRLGINAKSMASAMHVFQRQGIIRKVRPGVYMRIKEDEHEQG